MRKWTYLVAALLLVGTTATFTGCIDTDEPAGITDLRGAKAELIKAQAAVKMVEVDYQKALVANQLLLNEGIALQNKNAEIDIEIHKLDVELKKLEVERNQAATAEAKAAAEAAIAKANRDKATYENDKALAAEQFKAKLLEAQRFTAQAQEAYDNAIKAIEAAKLLMTDAEREIVAIAQQEMERAAAQMNLKLKAMQTAQGNLNEALTAFDKANLAAKLANALEKEKQALASAKKVVERYKKMLDTPISSDITAWENEVAQMKADSVEAEKNLAKAQIEIEKIERSADYKAAQKLVEEKTAANSNAYEAHRVANEETPQKIAKFEDKSVANNATVVAGLNAAQSQVTGLTGYTNGVFNYAATTYTEANYVADPAVSNGAATTLKTVENWIKLVDAATKGINLEDIAWSTLQLEGSKKAATTAANDYTKAVTEWEKARDAWKANALPNMATAKSDAEKAIKTWNDLSTDNKKKEANVNTLADALFTYYSAASLNGKMTAAKVTSTGGSPKEDNISVWILDSPSNFRNIVAPVLGIITYVPNSAIIESGVNITSANEAKLLTADTPIPNYVDLKTAFQKATKEVFGTKLYYTPGADVTEARLTTPTPAEIAAAEKAIANGTATAAEYGKLGNKIATAQELARLENILAQADAYKALKVVLVGQQTALKAEIAANTAIVAKALAASNAAAKELTAAEDALKALTAEQNDVVTAQENLIADLKAIIATIEGKLALFLDGKLTAEEFMTSIKKELLDAQDTVVFFEGSVAKAEKDIELYNKGQYNEAYAITRAQEELAVATKNYENAKVIYDKAVAQVKIVIDTLVK